MWFLISFNRPDRCKQVIDQIKKVGCSTPGILFVNGGEVMRYHDIILPEGWKLFIQQHNIGICGAMNICFKMYPDEPWYGLITDDEMVYTPGWDTELVAAAGKWKIAHANDHWQSSGRIHSYVVCGGDLVRECGWWALPGLWHWFVDNVWETLARYCDLRIFCENINADHQHWLNGRAIQDKTYKSGEERMLEDQKVFQNWTNGGAALDLIHRIREKII
jgi:glycosyltransferase involved in cell wall biosynthesis